MLSHFCCLVMVLLLWVHLNQPCLMHPHLAHKVDYWKFCFFYVDMEATSQRRLHDMVQHLKIFHLYMTIFESGSFEWVYAP